MPSPFDIAVSLNMPRDALWRVRASRTFMQFLVSNGALNRMELTIADRPAADSPTAKTRRLSYVPANVSIPDMLKTLVDDSYIEISDTQTWDELGHPFRQDSIIKSSILGDVLTTTATLTLYDDDDTDDASSSESGASDSGSCVYSLSGEVCVTIPLMGYYAEQAVIANMTDFYRTYPRHIDDFVQMAVKRYGDGTLSSLSKAVDKMMSLEKAM